MTLHDELGPIDLESVRNSPRAGDRITWHLATCADCTDTRCALGAVLEHEYALVGAARIAFLAVPKEQQRLLIDDLKDIAMEDF